MTNRWIQDEETQKWYYVLADGNVATNRWIDSYYVGKNGERLVSQWFFDSEKDTWYYLRADGKVLTNAWQGDYYLKYDGKMAKSEWIFDTSYDSWYYLNPSGEYANSRWQGNYYLKADGKMAKNEWIFDTSYDSWYYLNPSGAYVNSQWQGNYYLKADGKMAKSEWVFDTSYDSWYYLNPSGVYANSQWQGNYYLKSDGKMAKNEWVFDSNYDSWYFLYNSGVYARNQWVGNYYLKANGKMASAEWVDNDRYYVDDTGLWVSYVAPKSRTYYSQRDGRWASTYVGRSTMAATGCLPTSLAMIFSEFNINVSPIEVARWIHYNTGEINNNRFLGTSSTGAARAIENWGRTYRVINSKKALAEELIKGKTVMAGVGYGFFVGPYATHAIVLSGYNNGKTHVMEPLSNGSTGWYGLDTIWAQQSMDPDDRQLGGAFLVVE